jgi:hypothetical protein
MQRSFHSMFIVLALATVLLSCSKQEETSDRRDLAHRTAKPVADWLPSSSVVRIDLHLIGDSAFRQLEELLHQVHERGVDIIWLSPVMPLSYVSEQVDRLDPYPIQDFRAVNDRFGTLDEFRSILRTAHELGMRVVIDIAAGYTSWDSKLMLQYPDWFVTNEEGGVVSPSPGWDDIAALNYRHHELRKYMIETMKYWVRDVGVDGYVCQLAELVPTDFWVRARKEVEKVRPVILIADSNEPEHHLEAFDASVNGFEVLAVERSSVSMAYRFTPIEFLADRKFPKGSLRLTRIGPAEHAEVDPSQQNTRD